MNYLQCGEMEAQITSQGPDMSLARGRGACLLIEAVFLQKGKDLTVEEGHHEGVDQGVGHHGDHLGDHHGDHQGDHHEDLHEGLHEDRLGHPGGPHIGLPVDPLKEIVLHKEDDLDLLDVTNHRGIRAQREEGVDMNPLMGKTESEEEATL